MQNGGWKLWAGRLALVASSFLFACGVPEGVARLAGYAPEEAVNPIFSWKKHDGIWLLVDRPGSKTRVGGHPLLVNSFGLRGAEIGPKAPGTFRILFLGDSLTFGHGQPAEVMFTSLLQQTLADRSPPVEVINGGVPGWSTYQERLFYERRGEEIDPDLVLVGFVLNDVPELQNGLIEISTERGMLAVDWLTWLAERTAVFAAIKRIYWATLQPHAIEIRNASDLVYRPEAPEVRRALEGTVAEFERLLELTRERGDAFGVVLFPFSFQLEEEGLDSPQQEVARFATDNGVPALDTLPALRPLGPEGALMDHSHLSVAGHRIAADEIAAWLERESLLPREN